MKKVMALNFGDETCASSWYRILQYQKPMLDLGVDLQAVPASEWSRHRNLSGYDAVIIQKKLFSRFRVASIRRHARRLIYDLDDAIWHPHDRPHHWITNWRTDARVKAVARSADCCVTANRVLADRLGQWGGRTTVVPMTLDDSVWTAPTESDPVAKRLCVGWAGAPGNLQYLEAIEPALQRLLSRHPGIELAVFCGQRPRFKSGLPYTHWPYQPGKEPEVSRRFDIGLLPLADNLFAAGKSPIKGLQYLASGAAVVSTPLSATREILSEGETALFASSLEDWFQALERLVTEESLRRSLARNGRSVFAKRHTVRSQAPALARCWLGEDPATPSVRA